MQFATTLELALVFITTVTSVTSSEQLQCITESHVKDHPTPESTIANGTCGRYSALSCCTSITTARVDRANATDLENSWPICREVSNNCSHYLRANNCFYFCDPYLGLWNVSAFGHLYQVPVCASYCDEWFEACKNDSTCSSNWLSASTGNCNANQTCRTFAETFTNGKNMCNSIWSTQYVYDQDNNNCITMFFIGENPNENVTFEGQDTTQVTGSPTSTLGSAKPSAGSPTSSSRSSISATSWMSTVAFFVNVVLVWAIVCGFR